jgi:hypothetical protein
MSTIEHNLVPVEKVIQEAGLPIWQDHATPRPAALQALILLQIFLGGELTDCAARLADPRAF